MEWFLKKIQRTLIWTDLKQTDIIWTDIKMNAYRASSVQLIPVQIRSDKLDAFWSLIITFVTTPTALKLAMFIFDNIGCW